MAAPKDKEKEEAAPPPAPKLRMPALPKGPILLTLVNTLIIVAALGVLAYTKLIYKRPVYTETGERQKLAEAKTKIRPGAKSGLVPFEQMTVNIRGTPATPKPANDPLRQIQGKLHYATMAFSVQIDDMDRKDEIDDIRALLIDRILSLMGQKTFSELNSVQGRYVVRSQILDGVNELLSKQGKNHEVLATNLFFTQFLVQ
jgi:flagellar basal body-associated protein FliL